MNWRTYIVAVPIALFVLGCDNTPPLTDEPNAVDKGGLKCRIARKDSGTAQNCRCYELDQKGDTISVGTFHIDSLGHPLFRRDWHTMFNDSGQTRIHFTALEDTVEGTYEENADQIIQLDLNGDTLYDQSTWIPFDASDTVRLGSPFSAKFNYHCPRAIHSFYVGTDVQGPEEENDVKNVKQRRYETGRYDWFTFEETPKDTGHFIMHAVIYGFIDLPNTDTMDVTTSFLDLPFVVIH